MAEQSDSRIVPPAELEVRSKVWIEARGETAMCHFLATVLEGVDRTGSLAGAAKEAMAPYDTVCRRLRESEERLGFRLVAVQPGGAGGDITVITDEARDVLRRYRRLTDGLEELVNQRFREFFNPRLP